MGFNSSIRLETIWEVRRHDQSYMGLFLDCLTNQMKSVDDVNERWIIFLSNEAPGLWRPTEMEEEIPEVYAKRTFDWAKNNVMNTDMSMVHSALPTMKDLDMDVQVKLFGLSKVAADKIFKQLKAYDTEIQKGNLALNEGILRALNLITGQGGTGYTNAAGRLGVGNDATIPAASQTGLIGASTSFKAMDATFPNTPVTQKVDFQSTYGDTDAQFSWLEETIDNGSAPNENLNRANTSLGIKPGTETWVLKGTVTGS